ncbi:mitochondrial import receptor subunit tom20 [Tieghemiomyces parasiticus]|uniref:Mitochondrial import receptor subunit tom20 n=1 Tax=Tieghemiomyces parasiticus TaxID=78921 RepID=A0A9W8DXI9_9FUNG|nr:mitochondrial import receptor subunit tom20 [Tieghemiomyces parasiticus]
MKNSTLAALIAVGTLGVASLGYVFYFDYKRRNDPSFRRKLKREKKKAQKAKQEVEKITQAQREISIDRALTRALEEPLPTDVAQKEKMFLESVSLGESLFASGETKYEDAAVHFYRALKVYPDPIELITIYQKTIPGPVLTIIMGMLARDVKRRQESYYDTFPDQSMQVKAAGLPKGADKSDPKFHMGLVAAKDFAVGDIIYVEKPETSQLTPALKDAEYCEFCLKPLEGIEHPAACGKCSLFKYCSAACKDTAYDEYHRFLCPGSEDASTASSAKELYQSWAEGKELAPLMIAKFFGHMITTEQKRQLAGQESDYTLWERTEHTTTLLLPGKPTDQAHQVRLAALIGQQVPGLEEFMNEERYLSMKGRILRNAIAVRSGGEAAGVAASAASEDYVRSPADAGVTGAALYLVSSYLTHSCAPNAEPSFLDHDHVLTLKATRPIQAGEEITMSYIAVGDRPTPARQAELMEKFRLHCTCPLCEPVTE